MDESENKEQINEEKIDEVKEEPKTETKKEKKKKSKKDEPPKSIQREILEWIVCIVVAFTLAVFIKYFIFTPTLVKQTSMYPTIFDGERVYVNRLVRTFKQPLNHQDIVTLVAPEKSISGDHVTAQYEEYTGFKWFAYNVLELSSTGKKSYIKRVIGLPGDKIKIEDGKVYLNDELLDESEYLPDGTVTKIPDSINAIKSEFVVPEGYVFCMGDNRSFSTDCRQLGCIPIEKIEGRVVGRIWPLDKFGKITKSDLTKEDVDEHNRKTMEAAEFLVVSD